jgi:peptide/nickel transport system substrate-binding protein
MSPFRVRRLLAGGAAAALAAGLAACGGGNGNNGNNNSGGGQQSQAEQLAAAFKPVTTPPSGAQRGGTLTILSTSDVDYIDPGQAYYSFSYQVLNPTLMKLYDYAPNDPVNARPQLASGPPQISPDGKTVTVKIKRGVRFSPPVNREVTSADVKYAIERGFLPSVNNGYADAYFGNLVGLQAFKDKKAKDISGIQTPDQQTIVFKTTTGGPLASALVLPMSAPVPKSYAQKFDAKPTSTYGQHQVATGPYMIQNDKQGNLVGYKPNRSIAIVRNPNWNAKLDDRPALLDRVNVEEGNDDVVVASRRIINGRSMVTGDISAPPSILKQVAQSNNKSVLTTAPGSGSRYIALNTKLKPFDNLNVRKAVLAGFDRRAALLARGGQIIGDSGTHFIYPGVAGFEQAGGMKGPGYDFLASPGGNMQLAAEYMKKAGYPSGKYTGPPVLLVGTNASPARDVALITQQQLAKLGIQTKTRLVTQESMYTKFCGVPKAQVAVCPSVGWIRDFADPQTVLDPTFAGYNINQTNNYNWPQLDVPAIDQAMKKAEKLTEPAQRAKAWADIDRMITAQAPAIPYEWSKQPNLASPNVAQVNDLSNIGTADYSYTSLKSGT